jgi:hypothetical protein
VALPLDSFPETVVEQLLLPPDDVRRPSSLLVDYERGGIALQDPSQGINVRDWTADLQGDTVRVYPSDTPGSPTSLFTESGITSISLAFDQNMNAAIAYVANGTAKLYWYDPVIENYNVFVIGGGAISPVVCHDDKRDFVVLTGGSDVLLFYIRADKFYYRQQRERYTVERELGTIPFPDAFIVKAGMNGVRRVQVQFGC